MLVYKFDEKGLFVGIDETELDPLESKLQGKEIYLLPPSATFDAPEEKAGFASVWNGKKWEHVEDNRGDEYWLPEDKYGSQPRVMDELGAFPEGAIFTAPEMTKEQKEAHIQKQMTDSVQQALDGFAKTRGYDGIMSACSYSNSTDAQFKLEADYCIQLRDTTWRMGYAILAEVKAGNRPVPTVEELIAELPVGSAKWPDEQ